MKENFICQKKKKEKYEFTFLFLNKLHNFTYDKQIKRILFSFNEFLAKTGISNFVSIVRPFDE